MMTFDEVERSYGSYLGKCDPRRVYEVYMAMRIVEWEREKKKEKEPNFRRLAAIAEFERLAALKRFTDVDSEAELKALGYSADKKAERVNGEKAPLPAYRVRGVAGVPEPADL
jgi:hypothetical protein